MAMQFTKPIRRRVFVPKWGELVITFDVDGVRIRERGRLTTYDPVGYGFIAKRSIELFIVRRKAEARAKRQAKRRARAGSV